MPSALVRALKLDDARTSLQGDFGVVVRAKCVILRGVHMLLGIC